MPIDTFITRNHNSTLLWIDRTDKSKALLTKATGETLLLSVGDFITYEDRPHGVRIDSFTHKYDEEGPIGFTYLPWRPKERRWATFSFGIKGNHRHVIAYPCGIPHYGQHINLNSIEKLPKCPIQGTISEELQDEIKYSPLSLRAQPSDAS